MNILQRQIVHIPTIELTEFLELAKAELRSRRRNESISKVRIAHESIKFKDFSKEEVDEFNASAILSLPTPSIDGRKAYLDALMKQDWGCGPFTGSSAGRFYVYAHVDPSAPNFSCQPSYGGNYGGMPFYIGKGCGHRAFDLKRNQAHGENIRRLMSMGFPPSDIAKILIKDLSEEQALTIESKLIYFFGSIFDSKYGVLVNHDRKTPEFVGKMMKRPQKTHWVKQWKKDQEGQSKGGA